MSLPPGIYRADHVGSLLRPKEILAARAELTTADTDSLADTSSLRPLEDGYIAAVVKKQLDNGLRSVTDGEFRRAYFHLDFLVHLDGVKVEQSISWTKSNQRHWRPPRLIVDGKLGHPRPIQVDDFRFLQQQITDNDSRANGSHQQQRKAATAKVCIPSPTMVHFRGDRASISEAAYPVLEPEFFDDLARAYRAELADLYAAGCRLVQLDDTNLAYLCDADMARQAQDRHGLDVTALSRRYVALINAALADRPPDLVVAVHLCRGNFRSRWFAQGGYAPVAEVVFKELAVDAYFLEFDDARSGDFAPLRHLPAHKVVVLGILSSKTRDLPANRQDVIERVREAASFCPRGLEQLCLSHQCGFSSTMDGNDLSEEDQWAKIRDMCGIVREIWGDDN